MTGLTENKGHALEVAEIFKVILGIFLYVSLIFADYGPNSTKHIALWVAVFFSLTVLIVLLHPIIGTRIFYVSILVGLFIVGSSVVTWRSPSGQENVKAFTVPATSSLAATVDRADLIEIPAGRAIEFINGSVTEWTHDPLDGIQSFLRHLPVRFPFTGATVRGKAVDSTYIKELIRIYQRVVSSDPRSAKKYAFKRYFDELIRRVRRGQALPIIINIKEETPDAERQVALEFWKRAIVDWICPNRENCPDRLVLGPFYDTRGRTGEPGDSSVPLPGANMGELVATRMSYDTVSHTYVAMSKSWRWRFSKPGDLIANRSHEPLLIRLLMNDDDPKDNSPLGSCTVSYVEKVL